jgi:hypothetical protein
MNKYALTYAGKNLLLEAQKIWLGQLRQDHPLQHVIGKSWQLPEAPLITFFSAQEDFSSRL